MTTEYPTLLQINASLFAGQGQSSQLSNAFVQRWQQENPHGQVVVRDLGSDPLPHFDGEYLSALSTPAEQRSATQAARVALADQLIAELKAAQVLVLGVPMYNFGVPSQLKAWIDLPLRREWTGRAGRRSSHPDLRDPRRSVPRHLGRQPDPLSAHLPQLHRHS